MKTFFSLLILGIAFVPNTTLAAEQDAMFELYPHCLEREGKDDEWIFGPIPSPGIVVETRDIEGVRCTNFEVKDPETLQTRLLSEGDILDIDVVVDNPSKQDLSRVRAWLIYDPDLLEGESVEINDAFDQVNPEERDFSPSEGYVKLDASAENNLPDDNKVLFARVQFRIKKTSPIGTPITFHDVQPGGRSLVTAKDGSEDVYIIDKEPGVLLVRFEEDGSDDVEEPEQVEEPEEEVTEESGDDNACIRDADCLIGSCIEGECRQEESPRPNGESCTEDSQCASGFCDNGICADKTIEEETDDSSFFDNAQTAFGLLQVQNLRGTTEGSSVFLAWDHLQSSQLKAYNVYFGTVSGRYIQRRTVDKLENSITLRSLPLDTRYFFAVRGVSTQDEESAFSREISLIIGNTASSTAPLVVGAFTGNGQNPVANLSQNGNQLDVPGETGASTLITFLIVLSAVIGTYIASRRQLIVSEVSFDE